MLEVAGDERVGATCYGDLEKASVIGIRMDDVERRGGDVLGDNGAEAEEGLGLGGVDG